MGHSGPAMGSHAVSLKGWETREILALECNLGK